MDNKGNKRIGGKGKGKGSGGGKGKAEYKDKKCT
jgi:hypothetical protein